MRRITLNRSVASLAAPLVIALCASASLRAADVDLSKLPPAADKKGVTFAKDIKPIFEKSCFKCHGPEKQKGELRLDSLTASLKGSEHGKVIELGKSAKSKLVHTIARLNPDEAMPPEGKGDPLTKEQVGLVRAWIDQGAK
jgi:mono/diheme cytochrome c family protein